MPVTLFYIADPMCSWCWGFRSVLEQIEARVLDSDGANLRYVMGGLAPDSDEPMDEATRAYVRSAWDAVEAATGARFNREFWTRCSPRRSTYPSCRAVLAAEQQRMDAGRAMFHRIQEAYYTEARNPSDDATLIELAGELELDTERFTRELSSPEIDTHLAADFDLRERMGVRAFPSLALEDANGLHIVSRGYEPAEAVLARIEARLTRGSDAERRS